MEAEEAQIRALIQAKTQVDPEFGRYLEGWDRLVNLGTA
jgi:hypothetical protein